MGCCLFVYGHSRASDEISGQLHTFFLPITHRSGVDTVQYDCAMKIQNLCVHQTNGVTDYYSAELVGNKQHLSVKFFINAGGGGIVAYNSNDDLIYQVQSINGIRNIDISTWRNGDEIELCPPTRNQTR